MYRHAHRTASRAVLEFEPENRMMLEYKRTLAQWVVNEREAAAAEAKGGDDGSDSEESSGSSSTSEETSGEGDGDDDDDAAAAAVSEETKEESRLADAMGDLRLRIAERQALQSAAWNTSKYVPPEEQVEAVLEQAKAERKESPAE